VGTVCGVSSVILVIRLGCWIFRSFSIGLAISGFSPCFYGE
jgi:hypothetical protein